jgi:hypothetical protein
MSAPAQVELTLEDVRRMALAAGLTRFDQAQLEALLRAARAAQARRGQLDSARLTYADEPAHVFSLSEAAR